MVPFEKHIFDVRKNDKKNEETVVQVESAPAKVEPNLVARAKSEEGAAPQLQPLPPLPGDAIA